MKITGVDYENGSVVGVDAEYANGKIRLIPVVHGHWFLTDDGKLKCSRCGLASVMSRSFSGMQYGSKYCQNCGAKMDEDGKQDG